jgi:glycosyltransferase involved in cell wall biosynthesis
VRVAVVVGGVPNPVSGGGALTAWGVVSHLVEAGHEAIVFPLLERDFADPTGAGVDDRLARLEALGAQVEPIELRHASAARRSLRRLWRPSDAELFPSLGECERVAETVKRAAPDAAFVYHWEAVAATRGLRGAVPRLAAVGDPAHLPALYRWRDLVRAGDPAALRGALHLQARLRAQPGLMVRLLRECETVGAFAAHHAAWWRRKGILDCLYLRTPIPDAVGPSWREARDSARREGRPRILLIGHLHGTATRQGLRAFVQAALPALEQGLGAGGFEIRIVGGFDLPPELREALARPSVRFVGHADPPDEEFLAADVFVVPISIPLGVRVRILTAFSYGCCIVTNEVNALGIPELAQGENALLARNGTGLAAETLRALADESLRRELEGGARATFERSFSLPVAGGRIVGLLGELAGKGVSAEAAQT